MSEALPTNPRPARIEVQALGPVLGAAVTGVDLAQPIGPATAEAIRQAWFEHLVLVFPGQDLTAAHQVAFTEVFGPCQRNPDPTRKTLDGRPEVRPLVNRDGEPGPRNDFWHSDVSYAPEPVSASVLHGREVPAVGGDTMFCNMYAAYERLSPGLKRLLATMHAVHSARANYLTAGLPLDQMPPEHVHPVVRTHPAARRNALFVDPHFTIRFADMTEAESKPLLDYVCAQAIRPENVYRHRWAGGDVVVWDNRAVMHRSVYDYGSQTRVMHRTTAQGERPFLAA
ncbi:MAG: TauD/TfdA family dioxygenase [Alphaproteobacteria bacterium]|nr:TauD/TfdA family dioxygenase [Alphaproteobacteria bacterium]